MNALESTDFSKTEIESAKAVSEAAKYAEIAAGQSLVSSKKLHQHQLLYKKSFEIKS